MKTRPLNRRIGGSDVAKLLGVSKYGNAADVYLRIVEGLDDEWNPRMERGAIFEPHLRALGQTKFGIELDAHYGAEGSDYYDHPTLEFARAQIDDVARYQGVPCCVDYKTTVKF